MTYENEHQQILKTKAEFYKDRKITAHIDLKTGRFYNGIITEVNIDRSGKDFLIIEDRYLGEIIVLFDELHKIDKHISLDAINKRKEVADEKGN